MKKNTNSENFWNILKMEQTNIFLKTTVLFKLQPNANLTLKWLMLIVLKSTGEEGGRHM